MYFMIGVGVGAIAMWVGMVIYDIESNKNDFIKLQAIRKQAQEAIDFAREKIDRNGLGS